LFVGSAYDPLAPSQTVVKYDPHLKRRNIVPGTISRDELWIKIKRHDKFLLVETLPETAYHHAHLPRAINLPPEKVVELAPTLLPDKYADIVVYCASPT
jgi:rhodanese-related sulfurtransferase